jgi:hypothetical protein
MTLSIGAVKNWHGQHKLKLLETSRVDVTTQVVSDGPSRTSRSARLEAGPSLSATEIRYFLRELSQQVFVGAF